MGIEIEREQFSEAEYRAFAAKLESNLRALRLVLGRPGFGAGPLSIGAELELNLVDGAACPMPVNREVLDSAQDGRLTLELNRFNLELNVPPVALAGRSLSAMHDELTDALAATQRAAALHGARVALIGILPTIGEGDLDSGMLSDSMRYRALSAGLARIKRQPFQVRISGDDELAIRAYDVTFEGANTSFQIHLRVPPERFVDVYNAAQLATGPALAVAGNSPFFLGRRLWHETRVALFRQAVDDRADATGEDWRPARVSFGHGWMRRGAYELFAEAVAQHEPLLPVLAPEDPEAVCRAGGTPTLAELRLHSGTVWRWNRAVYDASSGGHLRVELRALPAGPTVRDMVANLAFLVGLTLALAPHMAEHTHRITFGQTRRNFYEAARHGLGAQLLWPSEQAPSPRLLEVPSALAELLPLAREGLVREGAVEPAEADEWLALIAERVRRQQTGASWQRALQAQLSRLPAREAWATLLERYLEQSASGRPVHTWPLPRERA
jgi:gamma-glutamyl:cysteine ligase YbdK (ATP-grasp superfamily)